MTLTFELDLDILPFDLHAEFQVRTSVRSDVRVVTDTHTDTHTDTQTMSKLLHPPLSLTRGVKIDFESFNLKLSSQNEMKQTWIN